MTSKRLQLMPQLMIYSHSEPEGVVERSESNGFAWADDI